MDISYAISHTRGNGNDALGFNIFLDGKRVMTNVDQSGDAARADNKLTNTTIELSPGHHFLHCTWSTGSGGTPTTSVSNGSILTVRERKDD